MRVIAGIWRGHPLQQPPANIARPTTDRVKEALMSAIESRHDIEGARVLDAFAGSGALGLEAASRGAASVLFCEANGKVAATLKANIAALPGASRLSTVRRCDVMKTPPRADGPFDLVFLDPPYAYEPESVAGFVATLEASGALAAGAMVYYEHAKKDTEAAQRAFGQIQWSPVVSKRYGDIAYELLQRI